MSYISAVTSKNGEEVTVWERDDNGERVTKMYRAEYYFYVDDPDGDYRTIYDTTVSKVTCKDVKEYCQQRRKYENTGVRTWEADIPAELRTLSKEYYNAAVPKLHVTFLDIEVDYNPLIGYSSIVRPYAPINSISIFHDWCKKLVTIVVPPVLDGSWTLERLQKEVDNAVPGVPVPSDFEKTYIICENEAELLLNVIEELRDSDVVSGWNSNVFDLPYIVRRTLITLDKVDISLDTMIEEGDEANEKKPMHKYVNDPNSIIRRWGKYTRMLDFDGDGMVSFRIAPAPKSGKINHVVDFVGKLPADYLDLYKKYEMSEKPSYKLAAIEEEADLKLPKLEYEGSLANLYRDNFAFFVRYNVRDTEILQGFERKLGYVGVANQMFHLSCGLFKHVFGTLKLAELAIVNHCHHEMGRVVNNSDKPDIDKSIDGAYVLLPQVGLHEKVGSIDIGSLYPNGIRTINISPETIRGQFDGNVMDAEDIFFETFKELTLRLDSGEVIVKPASEWKEWLKRQKWSISGYGTVFDQSYVGIIPTIITGWIATRKKYQALKKEAEAKGDDDYAEYCDRLQYVFKIKLNSLYGALTNLYFRFYDLRMGESTTGTGRMILKHQCRKVAEVLDGNYNIDFPLYATIDDAMEAGYTKREANEVALNGTKFNGKFQTESVIYGDTDSTYFLTHGETVEEAILFANAIAEKVNSSYPEFVRARFLCQPGFDDYIKANREIVSDRGIFVDKKRYILHIVDKEGKTVDDMKVMGLDTKKTTLPTAVSKKLNGFIERFLKGETWEELSRDIVKYKDELKSSKDIMDIGLPKGVNKVDEATAEYERDSTCRLSGGASAAIHYNMCLKEYDDKVSMEIVSGTKIKVFHLVQPRGRFKTIAIPTDIEIVPQWFLDNFKVDKKAHIERLVDNPLTNIIKAIGRKVPTRHSLMVDDLLTF